MRAHRAEPSRLILRAAAASPRPHSHPSLRPRLTLLHRLDTIGNAAFARLMHSDIRGWRSLLVITSASHMARTRRIFDWVFTLPPGPAAQAALAAARKPSARERAQQKRQERRGQAPSSGPVAEPPSLEYEEVEDGGHLEAKQLTERRKKEASALEKLDSTTSAITVTPPALKLWPLRSRGLPPPPSSHGPEPCQILLRQDLAMLHEFLFAKHDAYRASTKEDDARREGARAKGALAASY